MPNKPGVEELTTVRDVAADLGVHKATINRIAKEYSLGKIVGNLRILTKAEAQKLKGICKVAKGNPNFGRKSS